MIDCWGVSRILVAKHKVDFRKSFDGLLGEAYNMGLDPLAGDLVVFVGRCRNKIKLLFCDDDGIWVLSKRFHKGFGRRKFGFLESKYQHQEIDRETLRKFLGGQGWQALKG